MKYKMLSLTYNGPKIDDGQKVLQNTLTLVFTLLGIISVIVIIYAGIRLTLARGNPDAIGKLRSTIVYAAIGLVVAIGASTIISFVVGGI